MPTPDQTVATILDAADWNARVAQIRRIPQQHGTDQHAAIYAAVATKLYMPNLAPDFAYVHWRPDYEATDFLAAYEHANEVTEGFTRVSPDELTELFHRHPRTLKVFRVLVGFTTQEFAASTALVAEQNNLRGFTNSLVKSLERGSSATFERARAAAITVHLIMTDQLFEEPAGTLRRKLTKPDTAEGWRSVQYLAREGVPFGIFLHQRHYGGAFRQLLDATSIQRGDIIEYAVEELFQSSGIPYIRTGAHNQAQIEARFEVVVRPAPDFIVHDKQGALRAMLECKGANDGGTARDKAPRFSKLKEESVRLNGTPLFAVLSGLGWARVNDTLGPVIRDCDGRVFTLGNLHEILAVQPFPQLVGIT